VGIDDPLQLRVRRMQLANQRREGHVDDRDVEVDHERCKQQRDKNQGTAFHGSCDLHLASWPSNLDDVALSGPNWTRTRNRKYACALTRSIARWCSSIPWYWAPRESHRAPPGTSQSTRLTGVFACGVGADPIPKCTRAPPWRRVSSPGPLGRTGSE